jgi:lactate dehydrogenase-like 2-hydroxyacid dehydrogenase
LEISEVSGMNGSVKQVSFIGLGVMGYPMAGHLSRAGYPVRVYNRTVEKAHKWVEEFGGESAATPADAAEGSDVVFACVGNDDDIRAVTVETSGAFHGMSTGAHLSITPQPQLKWHESCRRLPMPKGCIFSTRRYPGARPVLKTAY